MDHFPTPSQALNEPQYPLQPALLEDGGMGASVPLMGDPVQERRRIAGAVIARGLWVACEKIGLKRLGGMLDRTDRAVRHWRSGRKLPGVVDLLLAARACGFLRARIIAFLHIPEGRLHRAEQELDALERQANALANETYDALARQAGRSGNQRRTGLRAVSAAFRGLSLRFRRREGAGA